MPTTPAHRQPVLCLLVAAGGAAGALARGAIADLWHHAWWATLCVNVVGAFVLGMLLEHLTRRGERQRLRLFVGTGFCGAFTTYSTFAHDAVNQGAGSGVAVAAGEVLAGVVAAALGAGAAVLLTRRAGHEDEKAAA